MSGNFTLPPPPSPAETSDRTATIAKLCISVFAELIFVAALSIAWWTKDPSLPLLLGMAGTNATAVVSYWIGSSAGSSAKDATIAAKTTQGTPT